MRLDGRFSEVFKCGEDSGESKRILQIIAAVFSGMVGGIVVADPEGIIKTVNPAFTVITGYSAEEAIGQNPRFLKSDRHGPEFYKTFWDSLLSQGKWEGRIWNRRKSGEVYPEWLSCHAIRNEDGEITDFVALFNDLSTVRFSGAGVALNYPFDRLSGLANRATFYSRFAGEIVRKSRAGRRLALAVLDINRFRNINDTLGHSAGDEVLRQVGARLSAHLGGRDRASRIGGDDFHILLPDVEGIEDISAQADKILSLFDEPISAGGGRFFISASIGISVFPDDGASAETLLKKADMAMHKAKEAGLNSFRFFTDELGRAASVNLMLETELRRGLEEKEFRLAYQPRYCLKTGRVSGMEALIRWHSPDRIIPPLEFIPFAEETGLILPLGEWVINEACRKIARWTEEGAPPPEVAVNLSTRQLHQKGLLDIFKDAVERYSLPPSRLAVEITESGIMADLADSVRVLAGMREFGMKVYVDDFGTGYSSLNYLKRLPINGLKIDKSFVDGVLDDKNDAAITRAVIGLGHALGMTVTAEGVETREQLEFLRQSGCDEIQGYLFSPPLPAGETFPFRNTENLALLWP
ncbi:MAG: putative bifunctional diguanylate cyclase/phosphodiesterase [Aminivibrio sp.]